jgi:ribose transport system permease protein
MMSRFFSLLSRSSPLEHTHIYLSLILLCLCFGVLSPVFATWDNFVNLLLACSTIGLLTVAAAFVIASGGIDLSVGSILALSASAASLAATAGLHWTLVLAACVGAGVMAGFVNGALISWLRIPAFISTLGMLSAARGVALILTDGRPVYGLPDAIVFCGQGVLLGLPIPVWIFLATCAAMHIVLRRTIFGIHTLSIGDNEAAVFNAGVNVNAHKVILYVVSGALAGGAGLVFMGRVNAADPSAGVTYELSAITGAILGGTRLTGGKASVVGAMVGALIIGVLQNGLTLLAIPSYYQQVAIGCVLILAVAFDRFEMGRHHVAD